MTQKSTNTMGVVERDMNRIGFHELLDWQILQYRQVVDEYRRDLSIAEGHCVSWQEAEQCFSGSAQLQGAA
jgi:hypothetical protein